MREDGIPDVCSMVEWNGSEWMVTGWLKPVPDKIGGREMLVSGAIRSDLDKKALAEELMADILSEIVETEGRRLMHCPREEATHLEVSGVCGGTPRVDECRETDTDCGLSQERRDEFKSEAISEGEAGSLTDAREKPMKSVKKPKR